MYLTRSKSREVYNYIVRLSQLQTEAEFIAYALPGISKLVNAEYHALIVFPNLFTNKRLFISNNPENFNREYSSHLVGFDPFLRYMIEAGNKPALLNKVLSPEDRRSDMFYNECDKLRPARDGGYFPLAMDGVLAGFVGIVRSADSSAEFSTDELSLIQFLLSLFPYAIRNVLAPEKEDDASAVLNSMGEVLQAGDSAKYLLKEIFGNLHWRTPANSHLSPGHRFLEMVRAASDTGFQESFKELLYRKGDAEYLLRLRKLNGGGLRRYFPTQAQFILTITGRVEKSLPFDQKLIHTFALTSRELDIIGLVYQGYSNKRISSFLGISLSTVKHHLYNIYNKVGVDTRTQMILSLSTREAEC